MVMMVCIHFVCIGYMVYCMNLVYKLIHTVLGFDSWAVYYLFEIVYTDLLSCFYPGMIYLVIVIADEDMTYCFVVNICYLAVYLVLYLYFDRG